MKKKKSYLYEPSKDKCLKAAKKKHNSKHFCILLESYHADLAILSYVKLQFSQVIPLKESFWFIIVEFYAAPASSRAGEQNSSQK